MIPDLQKLYDKASELENELAFLTLQEQTNIVSVNGELIWDLIAKKQVELYNVHRKINEWVE